MKKRHSADASELEQFRDMIRGCITCNGTQQLCGQCGNAENACRCGGAEDGNLMPCPDCQPPDFALQLSVVEKAIKLKAHKWPARCFEIATAIVDAGLVPRGELRYGAYLGPVDKKSIFAGRGSLVRHGWIEVPDQHRDGDGYIVDATRWVFECTAPGIAVIGANSDTFQQYDIGHELVKESLSPRKPPPQDADLIGGPGNWARVVDVAWPRSVHALLRKHFGRHKDLRLGQVHWLANLSPAVLGSLAEPLYATIRKVGRAGLIPVDYAQVVFKDCY